MIELEKGPNKYFIIYSTLRYARPVGNALFKPEELIWRNSRARKVTQRGNIAMLFVQ